MPSVDLSAALNQSFGGITLGDLLTAVLTLIVCIVVTKVILKIVRRLLSNTKIDTRAQKVLASTIKIVLYLITAIIVVSSLGIDMTSLVALLSVASLGITLAAEDILGNMAGGLVILSSHPFSIGDFIEVGGTSGTVEEISLNHTKLMTADGLRVLLPNQELASSQIINYTVYGKRRVVRVVTASYDAPTDTVKSACREAIMMTEHVLADPSPAVYLTDYKESSIEYKAICWSAAENYWDVYFSLGENLRTAFEKNGVEMTYDHLNVHLVEKSK